MAEYQKFIFGDNYSTEPANLKKIQDNKLVEAQQLLSADIEKEKQFAFEQGFQEGQKMALEKLKTEMDLHLNTLVDSITKINEYKPQIHDIFEQQSTACVKHLVNNMYFKSQEFFPEKFIEQSLNNALENLPMVSKILIKVPTNARAYLADTQIENKILERGVTDFSFVEDITLNPGECRIEWDTSGVLSSKVESFEKINSTLNAFLNDEDIQLSEETTGLYKKEETATGDEVKEIQETIQEEVLEPAEAKN